MMKSVFIGCGAYLPQRKVSNDELAAKVDTSDDWIVARTGISSRHIAADGEMTSDLAHAAAVTALSSAGMAASELDLIVLATATPDQTFPATATKVQARLGVPGIPAFDVQAVCSGFIYALAVADNFIKAAQARNVLVIGAETFSRILDWEDRTTCVLFGDGAGAVVLRAEDEVAGTGRRSDSRGIMSTHLHADGRHHDMLYVDGGPSSTGTAGVIQMRGKEVFRHAVSNLAAVVTEALEANDLAPGDINWLVPHQANQRIIDHTARKLKMPREKVVLTVAEHGNTSAASVPLALNAAVSDGRIKQGDVILMEAMGGGFTWGSVLARW
ncbi:MAG: beta-ketoacyl-ACP synthase III [Alphaproteobacteria bacterium]|jgi:3-oxoacyl-[acyl-carrier-protein] synthase-3|nr:3-oxoacyl-ACP synthase [Rhodospirillaceae bacterium]MDP6022325.1 beta-ketoacyl-ACP synthase III [Alphaproteobacteria bacterium]MDP6256400.1 beta-ketoacyl-ACP synthase III [Alphaproteobacteria bacterium]MDP7053119.1 beta-ketoacyl-ACP synthase III [Alphaproteobacteria bacterium]MDP7228148.1 beta-ketoacyl-ACP synthase III [Alphaproteobacteria bacterium]|tara:strand:- start:1498 stop:2481 length:984 start_codon:yes stop_codon:yes gene_type:complete